MAADCTTGSPAPPSSETGPEPSTATDLALAHAHLPAAGQRTAGHRHLLAAQRAHPPVERVDLGAAEVARQLHDVRPELAQRHLALAVTDEDVVDRRVP